MNTSTSRFSLPSIAFLIAALIPNPASARRWRTITFVLFLVFLFIFSNVSFAADIAPYSKQSSVEAGTPDPAHALVVIKNADGSVSIKVEDAEILHIDETGIRVNGNIEYTGVITDLGSLPQEDGGGNGK